MALASTSSEAFVVDITDSNEDTIKSLTPNPDEPDSTKPQTQIFEPIETSQSASAKDPDVSLPSSDALSDPITPVCVTPDHNNSDNTKIQQTPCHKKIRKKDWSALEGSRPMLRPRKLEKTATTTPALETPSPKKSKKSAASAIEPMPPEHNNMLPPHLPLADLPTSGSQIDGLVSEMPQLHSETSSSTTGSELKDAPTKARRRKQKRLTRVKRHRSSQPSNGAEPNKERTVHSPSVAECYVNPACPESSITATEAIKPGLCLCAKKPQVFVSSNNNNTGELTCQALDSFEEQVVGCCNPLPATTVGLHRPSSRTPYIMLCAVHLQRLLRHNCCPACGLFCSQGKFLACSGLHQYHIRCARLEGCLHCGDLSPPKAVVLRIKARRDPVFLPNPKPARLSKPAKMTMVRKKAAQDEPLPVTLTPEVADWTPPTDPPDPEKLAHLFGVACSALTATTWRASHLHAPLHRYTSKHLLNAVKAGDGVKLLQMMSAGLNPGCSFPDLKGQTCLHVAAGAGHTMLVHLLLQSRLPIDALDADQNSPLSLAVLAGHSDVIKYLVKAGASLTTRDADGMTPLHLAAKIGQVEACTLLLSALNQPHRYVDSLDDGGWTPLVWAAEYNQLETVKLLLREGGDPLIRDTDQNIALHWATYGGCVDIVELLLSRGSDISSVNVQGDTPLHVASRQGKYECVLLLLARGARCDFTNILGQTARECSTPGTNIYQSIALNEELNALVSRFRVSGPRILSWDLSRGRERNPVQCVNAVDDTPMPQDFVYIKDCCFTSRIGVDRTITAMQCCRYDSDGKLSPEFSYNDPPMIFECNQMCNCNQILCKNRVVQNGVTSRFQLFRTESRGWGLKTLNFIPKGAYVCEYIGEIISDSEADQREDDSYLFDLDNRDDETYCIDARKYGNLARFINHMCNYNLIPVRIFIEHQDLRFPRIAFFSNQDILPDTELGYNYGEKFWAIKSKSFTCTCGSEQCIYSRDTIHKTLEQYKKKLLDLERLDMSA